MNQSNPPARSPKPTSALLTDADDPEAQSADTVPCPNRQLGQVQRSADSRLDRVAARSRAIFRGHYHVSASQVAERLVEHMMFKRVFSA